MRDSHYRITLDITKTQSQVSLPVKLGDTSRKIYISLVEGSQPYEIDGSKCSAVFHGVKSDGTKLQEYCIIEGDKIRYDFTEQTTAAVGLVECDITLHSIETGVIASPHFNIIVDNRAIEPDVLSEDQAITFDEVLTQLGNIRNAESGRVSAEEGRVTAEEIRVSAEQDRQNKEAERVAAEIVREKSEGLRNTAEGQRETRENERVTAEAERQAMWNNSVENPEVWKLEKGCYYVKGKVWLTEEKYVTAPLSVLYVGAYSNKKNFVLFTTLTNGSFNGIIMGTTNGTTADFRYVETTGNKITTLDENSTDEQYPSAKAVYDLFSEIESSNNSAGEPITTENIADKAITINKVVPSFFEDGLIFRSTEDIDFSVMKIEELQPLSISCYLKNKTPLINENSTDEQIPTAKSVYDEINDVREYIDLLDSSEILDSGKCGENLTWTLRSSGLLRISGTGRAYDYCKGILIGKTREEIETYCETTGHTEYGFQEGKIYDDEHGQYVAPWYKYRSEIDFTNYTTEAAYNKENPNGWKYNRILIDHGITYIGDWMFYRVCGAKKLVIPEGVTRIGSWGIRYSPTLESVVLPNSLTEIEFRGLSRHEVLTSIAFGEKLTTLGDYGLADDAMVENIKLPETVTSIGINQFSGCKALEKVYLAHITSIPTRTFVSLTKLKDVVIPEEVTSIGEHAFYGCSSLTKINIPANVAIIDKNAFSSCENLHDVYIDSQTIVDLIADKTSCGNLISNAKKVYLKDGITSSFFEAGWKYIKTIDGYKQYNSYEYIEDDNVIKSGYIGATVYYILQKTAVDGEYDLIIEGSGDLTNTQYTKLPWIDYKDNIVSVSIGSGINGFPANAFREHTNLKSAIVPCETVPNQMFYKCSALETVDLTGVKTIGANAFTSTALTKIVIPDGVTTIDAAAFSAVTTASSVTIGKDVISIGANAFNAHQGSLIVAENSALTSIGGNAFKLSQGVGVLNLPNIVTIGDMAFMNNKTFTAINIGSSIESIGAQAFEYNEIATVTINKLEADVTIGENAFKKTPADKLIFITDETGSTDPEEPDNPDVPVEPEEPDTPSEVIATGSFGTDVTYTVLKTAVDSEYELLVEGSGALTHTQYTNLPWREYKDNIVSVSIGSGISGFPTNAFMEYTNLKTAIVPCETVPNQMFYNCSALETVDLTGVKTIGERAFANTILKEIVVPDGVTSIGQYAFSGVSTATSFTIGKDVVSIGRNVCSAHRGDLVIPEQNALQDIGLQAFTLSQGVGVLSLPNIVTIGDKAFNSNKTFTAINIGSSIESIGAQAFEYNEIATVTINKAQADITIGTDAFKMTPTDKLIFVS